MILNFDVDVIVHVRLLRIARDEPHRESLPVTRGYRGIIFNLGCGGDVIDDPIVVVIFAYGADHLVRTHALLFAPSQIGDAQLLAEHVDLHVEAVRTGFDTVPGQEFAEIFVIHLGTALGLAEGEAVVVHGEEGFLGGHFVHLELDAVVVLSYYFGACDVG